MPSMSAEKIAEAEDSFRKALEDLVTVAEGLKGHCVTLEDLIGVCKLACVNDGQLRMVMGTVVQKK